MFCYFTKDGFKVVHHNILDDNKAYVHADGTYYCGTYVLANVMIKDGCSYVDVFKELGVNNDSFKACFKNELKILIMFYRNKINNYICLGFFHN